MTTIHPSSLRGLLGDTAAVAARGGASMGSSNDPAGFASLLRQTHAAPAPMPMPTKAPAPTPPPKPTTRESITPDAASNDSEPPQESTETVNRARALLQGKPPAADDATPTPLGTTPKGDFEKVAPQADANGVANEATGGAQSKAVTDPATSPIDPSVMHWLAGLQREASAQSSDAGVDADGRTVTADTAESAIESRGTAKGLRAADLKADADSKDQAAQSKAQRADAADAAGARAFAGVLAEQRIGEKPVAASIGRVGHTNDTAAASTVASAPTSGSQAPAPAAVAIATPLGAPDFAQELGLRLSVLAKDGVQVAELHLNPAEMGPVSVQIVMDGTQARIDFGADMAATRQAIEAGLPELASALADAGFTLAGGGVSQHGGGHGGNGESGSPDSGRARHVATDDDAKRIATAARHIVTRGGVDVFA